MDNGEGLQCLRSYAVSCRAHREEQRHAFLVWLGFRMRTKLLLSFVGETHIARSAEINRPCFVIKRYYSHSEN
jgi:hypothetical protein